MFIKKAEYLVSATKKSNFPSQKLPQFALLGRSNVGKSSFINALCNRKNLAYTSSKPGKTITLNFFTCNDSFFIVDVPGYGYAVNLKTDRLKFGEMIENLLIDNEDLKIVFLIIDLRHDPTEDDLLMYNYLKHYQLKTCIIGTKADKIGSTKIFSAVKNAKNKLKLNEDDYFIPVSSITKKGLEEVEEIIQKSL